MFWVRLHSVTRWVPLLLLLLPVDAVDDDTAGLPLTRARYENEDPVKGVYYFNRFRNVSRWTHPGEGAVVRKFQEYDDDDDDDDEVYDDDDDDAAGGGGDRDGGGTKENDSTATSPRGKDGSARSPRSPNLSPRRRSFRTSLSAPTTARPAVGEGSLSK
jgi:hypothetical protein